METIIKIKADQGKAIRARCATYEWKVALTSAILDALSSEQRGVLSKSYMGTFWIQDESNLTKLGNAMLDAQSQHTVDFLLLSLAADEVIERERLKVLESAEAEKKKKEARREEMMSSTATDLIVWNSEYHKRPSLDDIELGVVDFNYIYPVMVDAEQYTCWLEIAETDGELAHLKSIREQAGCLIEKMQRDRALHEQKESKQQEEKRAKEAKEEEEKQIFRSELHEIVMQKGNESQREREEQGLLPESEALALLRDVVFAEFEALGLDRYRHLKKGDIPHTDSCLDGDWARPRFQTYILCALIDEEWAIAKNFLEKKAGDAKVSLRCHIGWCDNCSADEDSNNAEIQRMTIHITTVWNGRRLSREYFVAERIRSRSDIDERLLESVE